VLYVKLLSPFEAQIKGKHLLYVPSGPLTTLPLHVLVTSPPDASITGPKRYEKAAWLSIAQPITVLPSVSSLKSLRSYARTSSAPSPFAGFGNPLLLGQDGKDRSAWAKQACGDSATTQLVAERKPVRSTLRALYRDRYADVEAIRRQTPLPETADEICFVAKALGASPDAIFLGSNATETRIKSLSDSGTLKSWRVLHFATHGLVAGETQSMSLNQAEPALLLTPPDAASEKDDGLLTASEVAKLRLDADWVILSACNTAAADGTPSAEALSGLASAFLYAGARSLVVSHWYVNSEAAVKLITDMFAELRRKPDMPRAEALRWSIGARLLEGGARAHPSYWGPFVVVGAGG
jgi:CHAT domain-containing protein